MPAFLEVARQQGRGRTKRCARKNLATPENPMKPGVKGAGYVLPTGDQHNTPASHHCDCSHPNQQQGHGHSATRRRAHSRPDLGGSAHYGLRA
jgi:hypothetical protein